MKTLLFLSVRNFIRQRRRNILLGGAIAFGVMMLTVANAFSAGITDSLLNRIVIYMSGHVQINMIENGRIMSPVVRNRDEMLNVIKNHVEGIDRIQEDVGAFCRAVGNGKGDYVFVVGIDKPDQLASQMRVLSGSLTGFGTTIPNAMVLSEQKARYLQVKVGDPVRLRLTTINGQGQTGMGTVIAIVKSQNMFMDYALFMPMAYLKEALGYAPYETGGIKVILKNPRDAIRQTNLLFSQLQPKKAYLQANMADQSVLIVGFNRKTTRADLLPWMPDLPANWTPTMSGIVMSQALADVIGQQVNDTTTWNFMTQHAGLAESEAIISAITAYDNGLPGNVVWMNSKDYFKLFNPNWPGNSRLIERFTNLPDKALSQMAGEWWLLPRSKASKGFTEKFKALTKGPHSQGTLDVSSMYENAGQIVQAESVFNGVMLIVGAVIFFIIMIGVLNSLRMSIRERTREFGTMRAIGMKQWQVRWVIILEVVWMTLAGWLAGLALSFIAIKLLQLKQFSYDNPMNMVMLDRRLVFIWTARNLIQNWVLVMVFALVTAYFPARNASKMKPADALRFNT
jgi:ABC-type lipoprotein release transport system permease subunit